MEKKKGLLISPEFPSDSFWSYRYIMKYIGRKTPFPPLGLLTFASMMPDRWDFELLDLNTEVPDDNEIKRRIEAADAVFASAMNIQRPSLIRLLDGPARGTKTPWVLGGPMASTYRDTVLEPQSDDDRILHDGLDFLVWGEAGQWIDGIDMALDENPEHRLETPHLFIPERVLAEPSGSRRYLRDTEIFKPIDQTPVPRWDLVDITNYRSMMIQTTAGCRFRCNFCDIVQFNGGFARAKDKVGVKRELKAIYDTGFRGGVFTVDDNFVSEPGAMEDILAGMIEFQRENNYPFAFFTQASLDLGKESLAYLIPLMRQAGFASVFLGIENPDPAALKAMNKMQNIKTLPQETVGQLQRQGIEVFAGFIFGADTDTRKTADLIVDFVKDNGILSAMTGKLTPMPHTPLYMELKAEGRLMANGEASNNVDDSLQYTPKMSIEHLQDGFKHILTALFNRSEVYERALSVLQRLDVHIFRSRRVEKAERRAALHSVFKLGLRGRNGLLDPDFFRLLRKAHRRDKEHLGQTLRLAAELDTTWKSLDKSGSVISLDQAAATQLADMLDYAREAQVRFAVEHDLDEIGAFVERLRTAADTGSLGTEDGERFYRGCSDYFEVRQQMFGLPGFHLIKAFELAIMGSHYRQVVGNVLKSEKGVYSVA
jgi:radical SAM superfamily enzyme YgiQ (UPF0313 family)